VARPIVLADASPLIALGVAGQLPLLKTLFGKVKTTAIVLEEVAPGGEQPLPGEPEILEALRNKWLTPLNREWVEPAFPFLDRGEESILRAASNLRTPSLLLIDDLPARAAAKNLGFAVTGTAGILVRAKRHGLLSAVRPVLETLHARSFRLSTDLIKAILVEVGEC
jgi:uncharacterized protein